MSVSVRKKEQVLNLVYRLLNSVYGKSIVIQRDPLHRRYEVNRYGVNLYIPQSIEIEKFQKDLINRLLEKLNGELHENRSVRYTTVANQRVHIFTSREKEMNGKEHLYLAIY